MAIKNVSTIFIVLLISIIVSVSSLSATIWYMKNHQSSDFQQIISSFFAKDEISEQPQFHPLNKIIVNIKGEKKSHYVMIELAIKTYQLERLKQIDDYMPLITNELLKMFSTKSYQQIKKEESINSLEDEAKDVLIKAFAGHSFSKDIDDILFTKFVVQ